jgi:hypothetical protein
MMMTENRQIWQQATSLRPQGSFQSRLQSTASYSIGIAPSDQLFPELKVVISCFEVNVPSSDKSLAGVGYPLGVTLLMYSLAVFIGSRMARTFFY